MQAKKAGLVTRFSSGSKRIMMKMQDVVVALKTAVDISESSPPGTQRFSVLWITKRSSRIGDGSLEALEAQSSSWHAAQQPDGRLNSSISAVMLKAPGPLTRTFPLSLRTTHAIKAKATCPIGGEGIINRERSGCKSPT